MTDTERITEYFTITGNGKTFHKLLSRNELCYTKRGKQRGDNQSETESTVRCSHGKFPVIRFVTFATIEATGEEAVVYQAMYGDRGYWIRPKANFFELVLHEGKMVPRFQPVDDENVLSL